jgi:purine-binding chemotaxis protein CheW
MNTEKRAVRQFLSFRLGEEVFAIDVTKTHEVLDYPAVTRVPQTPPFMLGVVNLRGSVVPVIDLRLKFGMPGAQQTRDTCIIVTEVEIEGEKAVIGIRVDAVLEVMELEEDGIAPPPRIGTKLKTEYIQGMANREGSFLILLNIERVFSSDEIALVQQDCLSRVGAA